MSNRTEPALVIRSALAHELATIGAVTVDAYRAQGMATEGYVTQLRDAATRARDADLLVAVDAGGEVVGTVTFCPSGSPWREIARDDEAEFRMLAVSPAAQGRGVGRALVAACLDRARTLGFRGMVISTPDTNGRAHRMYEKLGFVRDPTRDWCPLADVRLIAYTHAVV